MKYLLGLAFSAVVISTGCASDTEVQFPMRNDPNFTSRVEKPSYESEKGPLVVVDRGHNNFFITTGLIKPLLDLLTSDGYRVDFSDGKVDLTTLNQADIFLVITPMSSAYTDFKNDFANLTDHKFIRKISTNTIKGLKRTYYLFEGKVK